MRSSKNAKNNNVNNLVEYSESVLLDGDLSLEAIGLYFIILCGQVDGIEFEQEKYREAFRELWAKNYLDIRVK